MIMVIETLLAAAVFASLAVMAAAAKPENITKLEKFCRNNLAGVLLSLPCTLLCVPLAVPVSPGFLINWLYPLAVVLPIVSYFYLDHYAARGVAFLLILFSYDAVHAAFDIHLPGAAAVTVIMLIAGIAGIWIAAKPCTLRDIFRKCAVSTVWKYCAAGAGALWSLAALYLLIMIIIGVYVK